MMPKDKEDDEEKEQLILVKTMKKMSETDGTSYWTLGKAPQQHLLLLEVSTELVDAIPRALRGQGEEIHLGAAQFLM